MRKDLVAVTGEYQNQQGEQKAEFTKIGAIMTNQNTGKEYALIDPAVSLAGVLAKQNALAVKKGEAPSANIMCSVMPKDSNQGQQQGYQQQPAQPPQNYQGQQGYQQNQNGPQF